MILENIYIFISLFVAEFIILSCLAIIIFYIYKKKTLHAEVQTLQSYKQYMKELASLTTARKVLDLFVTQIISHEKLSNSAFVLVCNEKKLLRKIGFNMAKGSLDSVQISPQMILHLQRQSDPFLAEVNLITQMRINQKFKSQFILVVPFKFEDFNHGFVFFFTREELDFHHKSLIDVYASQTALKLRELTLEEASESFEKSLGTIERSFVKVLEDSPSGMLIVNKNYEIAYANKFVRNSFLIKNQIVKQKITQFIHKKELKKEITSMLDSLFERKSNVEAKEHFSVRLPQNKIRIFDVFAYPILSVDTVVHVVILLRDRTKSYTLEQELQLTQELANKELKEKVQTATAELVAANKELRKANELKSEFVSTISHELRTPLTSIKGYISLLFNEKLGTINKNQKDSLDIVRQESDRLGDLINDILDFSRLESGKTVLKIEHCNLTAIITYVLDSFKLEAKKKKIKLLFDKKQSCKPIPCDESKMKQVLVNLVGNAIKFSNKDSEIKIILTKNQHYAKIIVSDKGKGIPEKKLTHIFDPFYQIQQHQTEEIKGTGLGLAIVKNIIDLHKGIIEVTSKVNVGTSFTIQIPLKDK